MSNKDQNKEHNQSENTMIRNMKDLHEQSKMMEHMRTNQELEKDGKDPDPKQHKEEK
ncbi:hypothetical protein [Metabacillus arenae]|uniref:Multidrug ABC transporter ATPase n=1 Tax=Metabacillus arenae TaxID=2771434 RepID=A0A926RZ09_9BACI|nr:hypothetical protein [Metabacillus arenae]MBD1382325.1 hypothetical protein [Metabacillus arenae]